MRPNLPIDNVLFLHHSVGPRTSIRTRETIASFEWTTLLHPPYSPDLVSSEYYLFCPMESGLIVKIMSGHSLMGWGEEFTPLQRYNRRILQPQSAWLPIFLKWLIYNGNIIHFLKFLLRIGSLKIKKKRKNKMLREFGCSLITHFDIRLATVFWKKHENKPDSPYKGSGARKWRGQRKGGMLVGRGSVR